MIVPMADPVAEYESLSGLIDAAVQRVFERGSYVLGPELEAFESEFAVYCGSKHAIGVASGTAALLLALMALDLQPGNEVLTVPNTDTPTTSAITHAGGTIRLVDTDPRSFNMDPARVEAAITERTRVVMPVHLFGQPADVKEIKRIAEARGVVVIEDNALAVGAEIAGQKTGTFGTIGAMSTAPGKVLGGAGAGGAVVTDNASVAERMRVLRNYGHASGLSLDPSNLLGGDGFTVLEEGHNERLDEIQAAVLRTKLPTLDERIAGRRHAAALYDELLADVAVETPITVPDTKHVYFAYNIMLDDRDGAREHLASQGIATRLYYNPLLHLQPAYQHLDMPRGSFPNAEAAADRMMALPMFPQITRSQVEEVAGAVADFAGRG
jgi:dTDP-4-amino-4,6-dideoxygalactose transaminase